MRKPTFAILTTIVWASVVFAQTTPLSPAELDRLLDKADKSTRQYGEVFRNLSAEETQIFEERP